jgi:hypothetical protein
MKNRKVEHKMVNAKNSFGSGAGKFLALAGLLVLLLGCQNNLAPPPVEEYSLPASGNGLVVLSLNGGERTLKPEALLENIKSYKIELFVKNEQGTVEDGTDYVDFEKDPIVFPAEEVKSTYEVSLELEAGTYKAVITGFKDQAGTKAIGQGERKNIVVTGNDLVKVPLTLTPFNQVDTEEKPIPGTFSWKVTVPNGKAKNAVLRLYTLGRSATDTLYKYNYDSKLLPIANPYVGGQKSATANTPLGNVVFVSADLPPTWVGSLYTSDQNAEFKPNYPVVNDGKTTYSGNVELVPGTYFMTITIGEGTGDAFVGFGEAEVVHIYSNLETKAEYAYNNLDAANPDFPRIVTLSGMGNNITIKGASPAADYPNGITIAIYTGSENIPYPNPSRGLGTERLLTTFQYPSSTSTWTTKVQLPEGVVDLQFVALAVGSEQAIYTIPSTADPATPFIAQVPGGEVSRHTVNIPKTNIGVETVTGTLSVRYVGGENRVVSYTNIEAYADADCTQGLYGTGAQDEEDGTKSFTMKLPAKNRTYYFKVQADTALLPSYDPAQEVILEKTLSGFVDNAGNLDLGTVFIGGKGFDFRPSPNDDLKSIMGWNNNVIASPAVAVYLDEKFTGEPLGRAAVSAGDTAWPVKAGVPYGAETVYFAFEYDKTEGAEPYTVRYSAPVGSYTFESSEVAQPLEEKVDGIRTIDNKVVDWVYTFIKDAEAYPVHTPAPALALPSLSEDWETGSLASGGGLWLLKPESGAGGDYAIGALPKGAGIALDIVTYSSAGEKGNTTVLKELTAGQPYLVTVKEPRNVTLGGDYYISAKKMAAGSSSAIIHITSAWDVDDVLKSVFVVDHNLSTNNYVVRFDFDNYDHVEVAKYFDPAFNPVDPQEYDLNLQYPWYWTGDYYSDPGNPDYSTYGIGYNFGPNETHIITITVNKDGAPYSYTWKFDTPALVD